MTFLKACKGSRKDLLISLLKNSPYSKEINLTDINLQTPLYYSILTNNANFVELLLSSSAIDVNIPNKDSGWTGLHLALYQGSTSIALLLFNSNKCILSIRDNEKLNAFDLFRTTFRYPLMNEEFEMNETGIENLPFEIQAATSVWTWGTNFSYNLGKAGEERKVPEQVVFCPSGNLPASYPIFNGSEIESVSLSKYHTAILSKQGKLFMNGFGAKGRLGFGNDRTVFSPELIPDFVVEKVALGYNHTIILTDDKQVFSCGSNFHGALGYETEQEDNFCFQLVKIKRKEPIIGIAASKYHSVAFNRSAIFTWGSENGQLGHQLSTNHLQNTPRKISVSVDLGMIKSASATNNSTVLINETNGVYVFSNYTCFRVVFQLPLATPSNIFGKPKFISITKVVGDKHKFFGLSSDGDVYFWRREDQRCSTRIWLAKKPELEVCSLALGIDSCLLVSTKNGYVFVGEPKKKLKTEGPVQYKFSQNTLLQHCKSVHGSIDGGFAALREDIRPKDMAITPSSLLQELKEYQRIHNIIEHKDGIKKILSSMDFHDMIICNATSVIRLHAVMFVNAFIPVAQVLSDLKRDSGIKTIWRFSDTFCTFEYHPTVGIFQVEIPECFSDKVMSSFVEYVYTGNMKDDSDLSVQKDLQRLLCYFGKTTNGRSNSRTTLHNVLALNNSCTNVVLHLEDGIIEHHSFILALRSDFFKALLGSNRWSLKRNSKGKILIKLEHIKVEDMNIFLKFLVMDWDGCFDDLEKTNDEFIQLFKTGIEIGNEFLVQRYKDACSYYLLAKMDIKNVFSFYEHADTFECPAFKKACLDFICWNLETFLKTHALDKLDEVAIFDIEENLVSLQEKAFPYTRGEVGYFERVRIASLSLIQGRKEARRMEFETKRVAKEVQQKLEKKSVKSPSNFELSPKCGVDHVVKQEEVAKEEERKLSEEGGEEMFEMEIGTVQIITPKKKKKNWEKFDLSDKKTLAAAAEPSTKSWSNPQLIKSVSKISLTEIIEDEEKKSPVNSLKSHIDIPKARRNSQSSLTSPKLSFASSPLKSPRNGKLSQKERKKRLKSPLLQPCIQNSPPVVPWLNLNATKEETKRMEPKKSLLIIQKEEEEIKKQEKKVVSLRDIMFEEQRKFKLH